MNPQNEIMFQYLLINPYKMGSIQGVISDEHGVDLTGIYHGDPDLQLKRIHTKNDSFNYPPAKSIRRFQLYRNQIEISG